MAVDLLDPGARTQLYKVDSLGKTVSKKVTCVSLLLYQKCKQLIKKSLYLYAKFLSVIYHLNKSASFSLNQLTKRPSYECEAMEIHAAAFGNSI